MGLTTTILQTVVFPGLLFTAVLGLVTSWVDRFVTARVQMRVGPPFLQPFYDIIKLMVKETCIPVGVSRFMFLGAPLLGLAGVSLGSMMVWNALLFPGTGFAGDIIVVLYVLTLPAVAVILGSFASRNPLASVGGSREMKLLLSYELPLVLAVLVPVIKTYGDTGSLRLDSFPAFAPIASISGLCAFLVAVLCTQAKLTLVPFDAPEAETELTGGAYIEYSGPPLAIFKLTRAMMLITMPVLIVTLFCGGIGIGGHPLALVPGLLKIVGIVVLLILIRNTAPRLRTDQAVRLFWGPVTGLALLAVGLAAAGW